MKKLLYIIATFFYLHFNLLFTNFLIDIKNSNNQINFLIKKNEEIQNFTFPFNKTKKEFIPIESNSENLKIDRSNKEIPKIIYNHDNNEFEILVNEKEIAINKLNLKEQLKFKSNKNIALYNKINFNEDSEFELDCNLTNYSDLTSKKSLKINSQNNISNYGSIICHDNLNLSSSKGSLITQESKIFVIGKFICDFSIIKFNNSFNIVGNDIFIKAQTLFFKRADPINTEVPIVCKVKDINSFFPKYNLKTLQNFNWIEKSDESIFHSLKGNISFDAEQVRNEGTLITANKIFIDCNKLENIAPERKNRQLKFYNQEFYSDEGMYADKVIASDTYFYCPTSIVAQDSIIINIDGKKVLIDKNNPLKTIINVKNTGYIGVNSKLEILGDKKSNLINGQRDKEIKAKEYNKRISIPLIPKCNFTNFQTDSKFLQESDLIISKNFAAYIKYNNKFNFKNDLPLITSPFELQEILLIKVNETIGKPLLSGYKNYEDQLLGLIKNGFYYAIIHGDLEKISDEQPRNSNIQLTDQEKKELEAIIKKFNGKITVEQYLQKQNLIQSGTHLPVLPPYHIYGSNISFIYFDICNEHIVPHLHLAETPINGSCIWSGGNIEITGFDKVFNYGTIQALNKLKINATTVVNERPVGDKIIKVHNKKYEIKTPLAGGNLLGFDIEIESEEPNSLIMNLGGNIIAQQKLRLHCKGNIENKPVEISYPVSCNVKDFEEVFGNKNSSLAIDYVAGNIHSTQGDINIVSDLGKIINEASNIIANSGEINLKGYLGVILQSLISVYTTNDSTQTNQAVNIGLSTISAKKVNVKCPQGYLDAIGALINGHTDVKSKYNNQYRALIQELIHESKKFGFVLNGLFFEHTKFKENFILQTQINGNLISESELGDNIFEATIVNAKELIHLVATKGSNVYTGAIDEKVIEKNSYNFGVSFFGLDTIASLLQSDCKGALLNLATQDPLILRLIQFQNLNNGTDVLAQSTLFSIEAVRLLMQYAHATKNNLSKGTLMGQRLGLINANGKFRPQINFVLTYDKTRCVKQDSKSTVFNTLKFISTCKRDVQRDVIFNAKEKVKIDAEQIDNGATKLEEKTEKTCTSAVVCPYGSLLQNGFGYSAQTASNVTYKTPQFNTPEVEMNAKKAEVSGLINTEIFKGEIDDLKIESPQDKKTFESNELSANGVYTGVKNQNSTQTITKTAGIIAKKELDLKTKKFESEGGIIDAPKGQLKADEIIHKDILDCKESNTNAFGLLILPGDIIPAIPDITHGHKSQKTINRSTISKNIDIQTKSDISTLNRDIKRSREIISEDGTYWRVAIPIVDKTKFKQAMSDIKEMLTGKKQLDVQKLKENIKVITSEKPEVQNQNAPENSEQIKKNQDQENKILDSIENQNILENQYAIAEFNYSDEQNDYEVTAIKSTEVEPKSESKINIPEKLDLSIFLNEQYKPTYLIKSPDGTLTIFNVKSKYESNINKASSQNISESSSLINLDDVKIFAQNCEQFSLSFVNEAKNILSDKAQKVAKKISYGIDNPKETFIKLAKFVGNKVSSTLSSTLDFAHKLHIIGSLDHTAALDPIRKEQYEKELKITYKYGEPVLKQLEQLYDYAKYKGKTSQGLGELCAEGLINLYLVPKYEVPITFKCLKAGGKVIKNCERLQKIKDKTFDKIKFAKYNLFKKTKLAQHLISKICKKIKDSNLKKRMHESLERLKTDIQYRNFFDEHHLPPGFVPLVVDGTIVLGEEHNGGKRWFDKFGNIWDIQANSPPKIQMSKFARNFDKRNKQKIGNNTYTNYQKIENTANKVSKYEQFLEKMPSYESARNKAMEILGDLGHKATHCIGKLHEAKGKKTGRELRNGNKLLCRWRLDWDPTKGPHINVEDYRLGKKLKGLEIVIQFAGNKETYLKILEHLNR